MPQTAIEDVIDEVITLCGNVAGINFAPDDPPDSIDVGPFAVVHLENFDGGPIHNYGYNTFWYTVTVHVGVPLQDMARANEVVLPYGDKILDALADGLINDSTLTPENFDGFDGDYGPFQWGGTWMYGWTIRMLRVKVQRTL